MEIEDRMKVMPLEWQDKVQRDAAVIATAMLSCPDYASLARSSEANQRIVARVAVTIAQNIACLSHGVKL